MQLTNDVWAKLNALPLNPRPRWIADTDAVVSNYLPHVAPEIAAQILGPPMQELVDALCAAFASGDWRKGDALVANFPTKLIEHIRREREVGILKPWSADSDLAKHGGELSYHKYGPGERDALRSLLQEGESIQAIGFWAITTSARQITREQLRQFGRPPSHINDASWLSQFEPDHVIKDAENSERIAVERETRRTSGPQPLTSGPRNF